MEFLAFIDELIEPSVKGGVVDVLHYLSHNLRSVCSSGNDSFFDAWALADCAFFLSVVIEAQTAVAHFCRVFKTAQNHHAAASWGGSPLSASSSARGLSDSVNLKRSSSCSFVCEIKKSQPFLFKTIGSEGKKTAGSVCYYLPSLFCIQLLLGFVSIFKGKKPFLHLRI